MSDTLQKEGAGTPPEKRRKTLRPNKVYRCASSLALTPSLKGPC